MLLICVAGMETRFEWYDSITYRSCQWTYPPSHLLAALNTIKEFSKHLSLEFQEQYCQQVVLALTKAAFLTMISSLSVVRTNSRRRPNQLLLGRDNEGSHKQTISIMKQNGGHWHKKARISRRGKSERKNVSDKVCSFCYL